MMPLRRFRDIADVACASRDMLGLAWKAQPIVFVGLLLLQIGQGFIPLGTAWLMKSLFDLLAQGLRDGAREFPPALPYLLGTYTVLMVANQLIILVNGFLSAELARRLTLTTEMSVYRKINGLRGLAPFEDPQFYDTIQVAAQGAQRGPGQALQVLMTLGRSIITLVTFLTVLLSFSPLLATIVGLAILPQLITQLRLGRQRLELAIGTSPSERRAAYFARVLSGVQFAKEVRLFGLADYFLRAFHDTSREVHRAQRRQQGRELRWQVGPVFISSLVAAGAFVVVALQAFAGYLSLGDVILYTNAVTSVQGALSGIVFAFASVNESVLFYRRFTDLQRLPEPLKAGKSLVSVPSLTHGIELRGVSFRYSPQHPWILRNVDLFIPAGQCVALVGLNGSGKTTLAKLLARLYDPTEGRILWDGIDLCDFEPQELRRRCGVILQDFVRYDLTAHENIGLGDVARREDTDRVRRSAVRAGIDSTLINLPGGYQTMLSRWLAGEGPGTDLSGGEWQKVALARMFMREADLLILDEPTAALDAQAEYELYRRFVELVSGHTALLISHRFSTVRAADFVAILEDGQVTESGTHGDLLLRGGRYAELFRLQTEDLYR